MGRPVKFFVRNTLPDGYVVRLASMEEKHFPTATEVRRNNTDGSIDIRFDHIWLARFRAEEYLTVWRVSKERPRQIRNVRRGPFSWALK